MEKKLIDFTNLEIENVDGSINKSDVSKIVGNYIYRTTPDLGMLDVAQRIYHDGCVEIDEEVAEKLRETLVKNNYFIACCKVALNKVLTFNKNDNEKNEK